MALVRCEVHPGLSHHDASVAVRDVHNIDNFLHVELAFLTQRAGRAYLPIGVVRRDEKHGVALIEFPFEADSGAHRVWVPLTSLLEPNGTPA